MFKYYINVPQNSDGIKEFEENSLNMPNVTVFKLTDEEYGLLRERGGLFDSFDRELGTIIDVGEETRIEYSQSEKALDIARNQLKKAKNETTKSSLEVVIAALNQTIQAKTFCEFDFFWSV